MIQSTSSATSIAALNTTSTTKAAATKKQVAAVPVVDPAKAVAALKAADAQAFLQRQQIGAALYDRSFTYAEGAKALARQDAIAAYAAKIQAQAGGPTEKQLAALAKKIERAEAQIQRLSTNGQGADLNSIKAVDGKVVDDTQANLAARIAAGVKDGSLTADEAKTLTDQQAKLADLEKSLRESNSKLTAGEQKQVLDELRKSADAINKARANTVGVPSASLTYEQSVTNRQDALQKQLDQGVKIGALTEDEAKAVLAEFDKVSALKAEAMASGSINWREATQLSSAMNEAEARIYELQRNTEGKQLAEQYVSPDVIDQRQTGQLEGITRGIDNRSLTNAEATTLLNGQQAIDDQQAVAVEGGLNRAEYLRLQSAMNDQSLSANTLATNTARYTGLVPPPVAAAASAAYAAAAAISTKPVAPAPASVPPTPVATAPAPAAATPVAPSSTAPGNSGSTPAAANSNGAASGNGVGNSGSTPGNSGSAPIAANPATSAPVSSAPVPSAPAAPTPATTAVAAPAAPTPAAPAAPAAATPAIETPASDVKAATTAETQPTTVQINRELADDGDVLPQLLAKMMQEQRADLQRYADKLAEKADEAKRQSARDEQHRSAAKAETHPGETHASVNGGVAAKVSSYARTEAASSAPAAPVLAKKVA